MRAGYGLPAPEADLAALKAQAGSLGDQLDAIKRRIAEMEGQQAAEK